MKKAVFLDRDGVINDNKHPINHPDDLIFFPWTFEALRMLNELNLPLFIVTNQGGIEMGYFSERDLHRIHEKMLQELQSHGITIDDIAYCPHFRTKCECRKPAAGMLTALAEKHHIDLHSSYMVGDRDMDIQAGKRAGCISIKIGSPHGEADYCVDNLLEAAKLISSLEK
jgi:D-glycero-D-manno-heptose 1,7-bisphosphate phosphatase